MGRLLRLFKSKIHRATVTQADLEYEGSLTLDPDLMDAAGIREWEEVHVWDVTNGSRLTTYAITGIKGSGTVCVNGAAAHLVHPGDIIIVATFALVADEMAELHVPKVVLVDQSNRIRRVVASETPGPERPSAATHKE